MDAKLGNFSELSNILSIKSSWRTNLMALFTRFAKQRNAENPNAIRFNESTESKLKVAVDMIKRAWSHKCLRAKYVLCDSWFTCEYLIAEVRKLGKGALHLVGLAKMEKKWHKKLFR